MTRTDRGAAGREGPPSAPPDVDVAALLLRFLAALAIVLFAAGVLAHFAQPRAEAAARAFVDRFGVLGMALGTLLADGLHFPVPPQFYMLLAIASHSPVAESFAAIATASIVAGGVGYAVSERLARLRWVSEKTARLRRLLIWSFERYGYRAALLVSLLPVPYSVLCYLAGLNRMPLGFLGVLGLCRIPKLALFYYLIHLGWSLA
jgi:membrane protein YqaA with SNARE-associated domain